MTQPEATVQYVQPGNIPQLRMQHHVAAHPQHSFESPHGYHHQQQQQEHRPIQQPPQTHENLKQTHNYKQQHQQQHPTSPSRSSRPQGMDNYQQQHVNELQQLEHHLRYLEEQHSQIEQEIQERKKLSPPRVPATSESAEHADDRRRSVRFASELAQDIEEGREAPSDESTSRVHKDSPTSVAMFGDSSSEQDKSNTSVLAPKTLFVAPTSILRRKSQQALDSSGRNPNANRGRSHALVFTDSTGREVSPIRSPGRQRQNRMYQVQMGASEDVGSIPDNPDDRDIAVLFDPDADVQSGLLMRKQVRTLL